MSFRVGFIGGNTLHEDHTQYGTIPFSERPVDNFRTQFPVPFTLTEIMKICWRVRKWKITGTGQWNFTDNMGSDSDLIVYDDAAQDPSPPAPFDSEEHKPRHKTIIAGNTVLTPDERYLVTSFGPQALYIATPPVGTFYRFRGSFTSLTLSNPTLQFPRIYYDTGPQLFYPFVRFTLAMSGTRAQMTSDLSSIGSVGVQGRGDVVGVLHLLSQNIDLYSISQLTGYGNSGLLTMSGDFTMVPEKYWPFANSDGLPVYDEDTGAQLHDPFS